MERRRSCTVSAPSGSQRRPSAAPCVARAERRRLGGGGSTMLLLVGMLTAAVVGLAAAPSEAAATTTTSCAAGSMFNGQTYCPGVISGVTSTSYGIGARVVLTGVSVTGRTARTVTVEQLESTPCAPGNFCGATMTTTTLTVRWKGTNRPSVPSVIDLYGTTTAGSLTPVGYTPNYSVCYIDHC